MSVPTRIPWMMVVAATLIGMITMGGRQVTGSLWTIMSPVLMTVLLLKVSGVALLEQTITERRPDYRDYMTRTNAFIPWFPRNSST